MLIRKFDPNKTYSVVLYVRMSDKKQNERSPDQQIAEIRRTIERSNLNWKIKQTYRDDGVKGALIRKRPQFSRMLADISSGAVETDLILVDTTERFARAKELNSIRDNLWEEYGVLLLTAENNFASPLTPEGKIYAAVEAMRATEENRIKAHQVLRAKRDTIELGRWPGSKPPQGYVLKKIIESSNGNEQFVGSKVVPDPKKINVDIIKEAFKVSLTTGKRGSNLAKHLKANPVFSQDFKTLSGDTVNNWLKNTLYKGTLTWGLHCTGIVNDVRKLERNAPEDVIVKEQFCEAIVDEDTWSRVNLGRSNSQTDRGESERLLKPLAPGFTIKYPLSGLVRCGSCGGSMTPISNKSKTGKSYIYYRCSHTSDNNCNNRTYIHEPWLREEVIGHIKSQIFTSDANGSDAVDEVLGTETSSGEITDDLRSLVESYLAQKRSTENDSRPSIASQIGKIDESISGWSQTLGNPNLAQEVRRSIEAEFNDAINNKKALEESLAHLEYTFESRSFHVDNKTVQKRISHLSDVLVEFNPSLVNIELSLHIDKIICMPDGTVTVRFCKLGIAGMNAINSMCILSHDDHQFKDDAVDETSEFTCISRRRTRLSSNTGLKPNWDLDSLAHWATDPHRFEYMEDFWFDEIQFVRPQQLCWAEENAIAVAECRLKKKLTEAALADEFGVSIPTIRKALKIAAKQDPKYAKIPRRIPRARWHENNAEEVLKFSKHMKMNELVTFFKKSDVTIRKAIKYACEEMGLA